MNLLKPWPFAAMKLKRSLNCTEEGVSPVSNRPMPKATDRRLSEKLSGLVDELEKLTDRIEGSRLSQGTRTAHLRHNAFGVAETSRT